VTAAADVRACVDSNLVAAAEEAEEGPGVPLALLRALMGQMAGGAAAAEEDEAGEAEAAGGVPVVQCGHQ
jgi:hypothetical protein